MPAPPSKQTLFIALAIVSLALVQGVGFFGEREAGAALAWRKHTMQTLLAISEVNERKNHTEFLVREFVLTGDATLASRAEQDFVQIYRRLTHARQLMRDEPNQVRRFVRLDATLKELTTRWTTTLTTRRTQGAEAASKLVADGTGRRLTDEAELLLDEMAAEEKRLLEERSARAERFSKVSSVAMRACGGLTLLFGLLAWRTLRRETAARAEAGLHLQHLISRQTLIFKSIGDGLHGLDPNGTINFENEASERMLGYAKGELLGRPAHVTIHHHRADGSEYPVANCPIYATLADGQTRTVRDEVFWRKDGTSFPVEYVVSPVADGHGLQIGAIVAFRDVGERRAQEEAVRINAERFRALVTASARRIWRTSANGIIEEPLADWEKFVGQPPGESVKNNWGDFIHPEDLSQLQTAFRQGLAGKETFTMEFRARRHDGVYRELISLAVPVLAADGSVREWIGSLDDVTEKKEADLVLRASRRELESALRANQLIMEHSLDVICTIDGQGRFDFVSKACERLWGYQPEELVGRPYIDLVHPEDHPATNRVAATIMAGRPVFNFENRYIRKDGTLIPVMWSASWSADEQRMFCVAHDISERKRTLETLRQALTELSRANAELDETSRHKDEFLANMSHELRTPLNAILGLSEALLEQTNATLTPRQVKSITTISTSGQHLLALINDILDLSKIEAGKLELHPEPLNVDEFCQSCLVFVKTQAMQKQISVAFEHDGRAATLSADPKRLKQLLVNLLTNAVKFTPPGGRIGLSVAAPEAEGVMRFTVWDSGIGIAPADQAKLFQAFTQVDSGLNRAQEGTGLGLALVARLVELHGGSVSLESEPGKGSRFTVALPLPAGSAGGQPVETLTDGAGGTIFLRRRAGGGIVSSPVGARVAPAALQTFRRALVIEDDPTAGEQLVHYLTLLGLKSALHVRGAESIEAALREKPDVILLDILLPDESGWVVLARLKEHPATRDIPVAVVSVVDEPAKSLSMGAAAHFTKPITREQLAGFLDRPFTPKPEPVPRPAPAAPSTGPLILLAEDNEANIQTIGGYLQDKGYAMHYALNGLAAVQLARELRPALVLMDIQMPMMDGLTAIKELRADAEFNGTPIIALTALAMAGDRERCLAAGATDYMSKPVKLKELAALVEGSLKRDA